MNKILPILMLLLSPYILTAQKGTVRGTVKDAKTGETLIGTSIVIQGTTTGTVTDFDGNFMLPPIDAGNYNLVISFVSYETKILTIKVGQGEESRVDIVLNPANLDIEEVRIVAKKRTDTDVSLLTTLKSGNLIVSGISAQQISRSQDKDAAEVVRRVPGITITDGRFIIVRGLIERYNSVMLNNSTAPSFEADKRAFSFDAMPSGLIDNILIYKSPAPELPADFAGAAIDIQTKNAADQNSFDLSYGFRYNENANFNADFLTHEGSKTDWLGFDNGARSLPKGIPSPEEFSQLYVWQNAQAYLDRTSEIIKISALFPNNWNVSSRSPFFDQNLSATLQRRFVAGKISFGNLTSFNYGNSYNFYTVERREYQGWDEITGRIVENFDFNDKRAKEESKIGVIHNWNIIYGKNQRIELRNFLNQLGTSSTAMREGINYYNVETLRMYDLRYESRLVYSGQLAGKQTFNSERTRVDWMLGYSYTNKNQPDNRRLTYVQVTDPGSTQFEQYYLRIQNIPNPYLAGRLWIEMDENLYNAKLDFSHDFNLLNSENRWEFKTGLFFEQKLRELSSRLLGVVAVRNPPDIFFKPAEEAFSKENFYFDQTPPYNQHGLSYRDNTRAKDSYDATDKLQSGYVALNIPINNKINLYGGVRLEQYNRVITNFFEKTGSTDNQDIVRDTLNLFPSANLTYNLNDKNLLRLSYGKTVNRPEFREMSNFDYQDFELFAVVHGNEFLQNASVDNYDIRYEWYPELGEMISVAGFYKSFVNPIEIFQIPAGTTFDYKPFNTEKAYSAGIEFDVRKRFSSFANKAGFFRFMKDLTVVFNTSLIKSEINTEKQGFARDSVRIMQGQSPYIINLGLFYQSPDNNLSVNLNYNTVGKRIAYVGTPNNPHTWELSRNSLDLTLQKGFGERLSVKAGVKDIFNEPVKYVQYHGSAEDKIGQSMAYRPNRQLSFSITLTL